MKKKNDSKAVFWGENQSEIVAPRQKNLTHQTNLTHFITLEALPNNW